MARKKNNTEEYVERQRPTIDRKRITKYIDNEKIYSESVSSCMIEDLILWFRSQGFVTWRDVTAYGFIRFYQKENVRYEIIL